jgi:zinc protease
MINRHGARYGLLGLLVIVLLGVVAFFMSRPAQAPATPPMQEESTKLQSLTEVESKPLSRRTLDIQSWQTKGGARVLFVEAHELPMFDLRLTFAAGSSQDDGHPGVALMTNAMLNEGIPGKDVTAIAEGFEGLGAAFGNGSYRDMAVVSLRSLSDKTLSEPSLALFDQVIGQPTFPEDSLQRIKNQILASLEQQKQDPGKLANNALFQHLYGEHPYGHPADGTPESIAALTVDQLRAFHARAYSAGNAVIALVGDMTRAQAEAMAERVSGALPQGPALASLSEPQTPEAGVHHIEYPSAQTHLLLAQLGIERGNPDQAALTLGNQILGGGGFGARLMEEVREKRGLTYGVYSGFSGMATRGPFTISLQTRAEQSQGTLDLVRDIVRKFLADGPTQKEVDDAKRQLVGSFPLSTASNADIAAQLGSIGFYDLPLDYLEDFMNQVQALTVEQVKGAMSQHLDPDAFVVVTAGPTVEQKPLPPPTEKPAQQPSTVPEH